MSSDEHEQKIHVEVVHVEVVLALPQKQTLLALDVLSGSTVAQAIEQSGIIDLYGDAELDLTKLGIFGQKVSPDRVLLDGDRVEIYRPLLIDPKEIRRQRALKQAKT